jgi:hypothetical protein
MRKAGSILRYYSYFYTPGSPSKLTCPSKFFRVFDRMLPFVEVISENTLINLAHSSSFPR